MRKFTKRSKGDPGTQTITGVVPWDTYVQLMQFGKREKRGRLEIVASAVEEYLKRYSA